MYVGSRKYLQVMHKFHVVGLFYSPFMVTRIFLVVYLIILYVIIGTNLKGKENGSFLQWATSNSMTFIYC